MRSKFKIIHKVVDSVTYLLKIIIQLDRSKNISSIQKKYPIGTAIKLRRQIKLLRLNNNKIDTNIGLLNT